MRQATSEPIRAERREVEATETPSALETALLLKLENLFPAEQTKEYQALCQRSDAGRLTDAERSRLLALIEQRDHQNADRLEILGELARLRGVPLRDVMAQLHIRPE